MPRSWKFFQIHRSVEVHRPDIGGILYQVCPSVCESVHPENLVNTVSQEPILVTDIFGFIDVLIRFWGQKVTADRGITSSGSP